MFRTHALVVFVVMAALPAAVAASGDRDAPDVLLSRQLMEARELQVGDVVRLSASPDGRQPTAFRVAGSYEPLPNPFRLTASRMEARLHLPDMIDLAADPTDPQAVESVRRINVALDDPADAETFARDVRTKVPGLSTQPTGRINDAQVFLVLERFHTAIAAVTVIGSAAFLLALMVIRSEERRETTGILRLIGLGRRRILLEIFVEGVLIAVSGSIVGILIAVALEGLFNVFFQWHYDTALVFVRVTPGIALRCIAISVPLGILAGIAASWSLLRQDIMTLLRR